MQAALTAASAVLPNAPGMVMTYTEIHRQFHAAPRSSSESPQMGEFPVKEKASAIITWDIRPRSRISSGRSLRIRVSPNIANPTTGIKTHWSRSRRPSTARRWFCRGTEDSTQYAAGLSTATARLRNPSRRTPVLKTSRDNPYPEPRSAAPVAVCRRISLCFWRRSCWNSTGPLRRVYGRKV